MTKDVPRKWTLYKVLNLIFEIATTGFYLAGGYVVAHFVIKYW